MDIKDILIQQDLYRFIMNIKDEKLRKVILSQCRIIEYKAEEYIYSSTRDKPLAFIFLEGRVNIRAFINDTTDYIIPWTNDNWYGALSILAEDSTECEMLFLEDTTVLSFPLKDILYSEPKENYELWMRVAKMGARNLRGIQVQNIKRAALSTEVYFLTCFRENGYHFDRLSIPEISYILKINTRTLQRLIQILEKKGLIYRDKVKKTIYARDTSRIDDYLESIK